MDIEDNHEYSCKFDEISVAVKFDNLFNSLDVSCCRLMIA